MALWLVRMGKHGEFEQRFVGTNRVYVTWDELKVDLASVPSQPALVGLLQQFYPNAGQGTIRNWTGQIFPFVHTMKVGDWVIVPYKTKPAINVAEITGPYEFDPQAECPYYHSRTVKWIAQDVPRSRFDQDLLFSFGAVQTICRIQRNDAESRIREMSKNGWKSVVPQPDMSVEQPVEGSEVGIDLEEIARDQIAKWIIAKFKGHGLARLVESVLKAQGYTTYRSPEGADKGVDILASSGPLGFGETRLCVQVKSSDAAVDLPTMNQLIGAMQNVHASHGLFVSWGGFKSSVDKEIPSQFFRVRLWDRDDLIRAILEHYDTLEEELRGELPLKRIWTIAMPEDDESSDS